MRCQAVMNINRDIKCSETIGHKGPHKSKERASQDDLYPGIRQIHWADEECFSGHEGIKKKP